MKREVSGIELQGLIDAIKASDVVENRTQLIAELGELDVTEESERASLLECLIIFWEDFTCLDASQCMLNKAILHVAAKYLESDASRCLGKFLDLGAKASIWCGKHLKMTLMSTGDSQEEEHYSVFFQVLLDMLAYCAAAASALARNPVSSTKELMAVVERSILEFLNLTKVSISEIKRIQTFGSEVLTASQTVLDALIRLCRVYCNGIKLDLHGARTEKDINDKNSEDSDKMDHVINLMKCTVEKLCELGTLAAMDGGSLVSVLNFSWKGVISLLQLGKGALEVKLNIADIILALISLANGSIRCAAETWSSPLVDTVQLADAKRIFLPVKFFLVCAARIVSHFPSQAFSVFKEITIFVLMISSFRISLGNEILKSASEALTEVLEPTSFHLLSSLLGSAQLEEEQKCQIMDWLFTDGNDSHFIPRDPCGMGDIFSISCDSMHASKMLLLGRVTLFVNLLKSAPELDDVVRLGIAKRLEWLFNVLIHEEVYSSILVLQVPVLDGSGQKQEVAYQTMFSSILHAMKIFMLVVSSTLAWRETESFLLENFLHPHFLCSEIVMELWCFLLRHADPDLANEIIDKLCFLLRLMASSDSVLVPSSPFRKLARSICMLLSFGSQSLGDQVFNFIIGTNGSKLQSAMYIALLMEGFPLNSLSEKVKTVAKENLVSEYFSFLENFDDDCLRQHGYGVFGAPVFALSAALQSLQVSISDTEAKTLKLLVSVIHKYTNSEGKWEKDQYRKLLSETLGIISSMTHLYTSDEMERVILELQSLFISKSAVSDTELIQCRPNLSSFMAGLGHLEFEETNDSAKMTAAWELFHMLLRERHWALAHLAITAFGYFSARTTCSELWRFMPQDAALSYDLESGKIANEERFLSEFKVFLEKEMVSRKPSSNSNELDVLVKEGLVLKEMVQRGMRINKEAIVLGTDAMEVDDLQVQQANKRRKLPDDISKGVAILQSGLKVIADGLSQWQQSQLDSAELHGKLLTEFSHLEDVVGHLGSLIDTE